jgi:DNA polymerase-3 subunit epsilon
LAFSDLGVALAEVEFVVVDLETTGGSPKDSRITEIGAVRVRGGEVLGEFQTLVNPELPIPAFIAALTGITDAALADAPRIASVLPSFLEFARGAVLVAHNAGFDTGFLRAACRQLELPWPAFPVVDTARLARVLLHADEVPNNKLATLARHFRAATEPDHRALSDARATVDVLHGLLERAAAFGATHLNDLLELGSRVTRDQRRKRTLADGLPDRPGVYVFTAPDGRPLYVGKSRSIRTRVRNYFTASETRARIVEMVRIAERVEAICCATDLEAQIREVRLIAQHRPPYNRRSRSPERAVWVKLTAEAFPRLAIVREPGADAGRGAVYCGPFPSRRSADMAREALLSTVPLRTCTHRIARSVRSPACIAADLGTCVAPCRDAGAHEPYADLARLAAGALIDPSPVVAALGIRMRALAAAEEFEAAVRERERLRTLLAGAVRTSERHLLASSPQIVAARADGRDWELHVIRFGRLAGAARVRPGEDPKAVVAAAVAAAEHVDAPDPGHTAALPEESALLLSWLWQPGVRLVSLSGELLLPLNAPQRHVAAVPAARPLERRERQTASAATATQWSRILLAAPESTASLARST